MSRTGVRRCANGDVRGTWLVGWLPCGKSRRGKKGSGVLVGGVLIRAGLHLGGRGTARVRVGESVCECECE